MGVSTKISSGKSLKKVSMEKPVSVYSVNFERVINNLAEKKLRKRKVGFLKSAAQSPISQKVFKWRNAVAVAAILMIGVLHFVFQVSFISREVAKNRPVVEAPPVENEPARVEPAVIEPAVDETKNVEAPLPPRTSRTIIKQRPVESVPIKPQLKKKEPVESRAERLRRAERILTGV